MLIVFNVRKILNSLKTRSSEAKIEEVVRFGNIIKKTNFLNKFKNRSSVSGRLLSGLMT